MNKGDLKVLDCSIHVRAAQARAIVATIGHGAVLQIRSGAPPELSTYPDAGEVLSVLHLTGQWLLCFEDGRFVFAQTRMSRAVAAGSVGHFCIKDGVTGTTQIVGTSGIDPACDLRVDRDRVSVGDIVTLTSGIEPQGIALTVRQSGVSTNAI